MRFSIISLRYQYVQLCFFQDTEKEIIGKSWVKWTDVDLEAGTLRVQRSVGDTYAHVTPGMQDEDAASINATMVEILGKWSENRQSQGNGLAVGGMTMPAYSRKLVAELLGTYVLLTFGGFAIFAANGPVVPSRVFSRSLSAARNSEPSGGFEGR